MKKNNEKNYGYIYRIYKKDNQKSYIGQTIDLKYRIQIHFSGKCGTGIGAAIKKHGLDAFSWEILEQSPKSNLLQREIVYIAMFNTFKGFGYNKTPGGDGYSGVNHPMYGKKHSKETIQRMSDVKKGKPRKPHTEEFKEYMSELQKDGGFSTGYKHTEEAKRKISEGNKGKKYSEESREKMSRSQMGNQNSLGNTHSKETRRKQSEARKEWWRRKREKENTTS